MSQKDNSNVSQLKIPPHLNLISPINDNNNNNNNNNNNKGPGFLLDDRAGGTRANTNKTIATSGCLDITLFELLDIPNNTNNHIPLGVRFTVVGGGGNTAGNNNNNNNNKKSKSLAIIKSASTGTTTQNNIQKSVWSGPPSQQQQKQRQQNDDNDDGNTTTTTTTSSSSSSFRFTTKQGTLVFAGTNMTLNTPLAELYHSKLKIEVVYSSNNNSNNNTLSGNKENNTAIVAAAFTSKPKQQQRQSPPVTIYETKVNIRQLCIDRPQEMTLKLQSSKIVSNTLTVTENVATMLDEQNIPPKIRLKLHLQGPMRKQVQLLLQYFHVYLHLIDTTQQQLFQPIYEQIIKPIIPMIPIGVGLTALPVITMTVVVSPIIIGITILFFPITIPILVLLGCIMIGAISIISILLCSMKQSREYIDTTIIQNEWIQHYIFTSPVTQAMIYETGNDDAIPNPISFLRWYVVPDDIWYKLCMSLCIDILGSMSYIIPIVGESFDGPWGPIQSMLIMAMYNNTTPNLKYVSLAEEWLPFTDVLPSATIGWATENMPTLVEEWKDIYNESGGTSSLTNMIPFMGGSNAGANSGTSSNTTPTNGRNGSKKDLPTEEQKRSILKDMQNYSEKLSVNP